MTSLPIYWPADADIEQIASGEAPIPHQRSILEWQWELVPLDTLSPIPGLTPDAPMTDPLAGLEQIAIIQPRALTPQDNVALDDWVRAGGRVLLVLDPMLSGNYRFAVGDPRRPIDVALIPPVVERWGLTIAAREGQDPDLRKVLYEADQPDGPYILRSLAGEISEVEGADPDCDFYAERIVAQCRVGEGLVTLAADAASFEFGIAPFDPLKRMQVPTHTLPLFAFPRSHLGQ